ncbi:MAG: EF-hand domain-containing protein [Candidatus Sericytochromatia bacterium]
MKILFWLVAMSLTACTSGSASDIGPNGIPNAILDPAEYTRVLTQIDSNGDQSITAAEIRASGLDPGRSILYSQTQAVAAGQTPEKYIALYDADDDQKLSPLELKYYALVALFKSIDTNQDGGVDRAELLAPGHAFSNPTQPSSPDAPMEADVNKDGKITFEEFVNIGQASPGAGGF